MINLLSYVGMNLQSELCLWTLLGLLRTIFDATLFKVNANLKQVWQMSMPVELSLPVQRVLRTMISGVMLVQCFTVYVYLASYIVLLYPVFLEERPTLVLPWLLLAAVRKFLCELTSLALGLGACLLLGPARPPCIKFVVTKIASITPAFYMWLLVFSYYNTLKVASAFKTFPAVLQSSDHDYGLELAVRRRRTKSLQDEKQLRKKIVASFNYESGSEQSTTISTSRLKAVISNSTDTDVEDSNTDFNAEILRPLSATSERLLSNLGSYEDWCGNEVMLPRDADRILEQFVLMLLRISAFIKIDGTDPAKLFSSASRGRLPYGNMDCAHLSNEEAETPLLVGNSKGRTASYLQEYPQIFMKKASDSLQRPYEQRFETVMGANNQIEGNTNNEGTSKNHKLMDSTTSAEIKPLEIDAKISNKNVITPRNSVKKIANTLTLEKTGNVNIDMKIDTAIENPKEDEITNFKSVSVNKMTTSNVKHVQSLCRTNASNVKSSQPANNSLTTFSTKSRESVIKIATSDKISEQSPRKETRLNDNQLKISSNKDLRENMPSQDDITASVDSIQNIINKMKDSLSKNKKSHRRDENKDETNCPAQSNPSTAPVAQRNISEESMSSKNSKSSQHTHKDNTKS